MQYQTTINAGKQQNMGYQLRATILNEHLLFYIFLGTTDLITFSSIVWSDVPCAS